MTDQKEEQEHKPSFKLTHVLILSILITAITLNKVSEFGKNSLEASKKLSQMEQNFLRNLDFDQDTESVCKKADEKLQNYYKTGDASLIGLDNSTRKESSASYIKALTDIIAEKAGGSTGRRLAEEEDDSGADNVTENLKKYLMHVIPVLAFFAVAILSIPGWIVCCGCCCCNCCCCCCCKRPICRFPFFIVTMAFNVIVFIVCIYGLASSNKVFVGFANVECALMKFIGEVTDGETRQTKPRWPGFQQIKDSLGQIVGRIDKIKANSKNDLDTAQTKIDEQKGFFNEARITFINYVYDETHKKEIDGNDYWISTYAFCGTEENTKKDTFIYAFKQQYSIILNNADTYISSTKNNFDDVFAARETINSLVTSAQGSIDSIKKPVDDIKNMVADAIINYSDTIDKNGKLGFKLVYSVLTIIVAVNAALVVVYFVFGTSLCLNCKTLRCLNKLFIHIFWNISALLMIITFIVGAILTLVGTLGNDLVSVVSFLIGEENLNVTNSKPLLFGDSAQYLTTCLIGNGDLSSVFNFSTSPGTQNITQLQSLQTQINQVVTEFNEIKEKNMIQEYNNDIISNKDGYNGKYVDIQICLYENRQPSSALYGCTNRDELNDENDNGNHKRQLITDSLGNLQELSEKLGDFKQSFSALMDKEVGILTVFNNTIRDLTSLFDDFVGTSGASIFSFLNCKFIGNNLDIILKYLKEAIGKNIYTVGIFLLVAGCSMIFSIIFTILEVIIINAAVDDKLKSAVSGVSKFV